MSKTVARLANWAHRFAAPSFWGLWATVLLLQVLDVGSVLLASAVGAPIHEVNPVVLALIARDGLLLALLVKFTAAAAWLALILGVWLLCAPRGWRVGMLTSTLLIAGAAAWSAWVFWANVAAVVVGV